MNLRKLLVSDRNIIESSSGKLIKSLRYQKNEGKIYKK